MRTSKPLLFSAITLRGITLKNPVVISPMCQYSAHDGLANDWHFVHPGKMATGGAGDSARACRPQGLDAMEMHSAHGYLGHEFLSPLSNKRIDQYGGNLQGRMRYTLALAEVLRAAWPKDKPLFVRISSVDGIEGGRTLDDTVTLAKELAARGVDVVDCSSGGLLGSATAARIKRSPGFQVPFAERVRRQAGIKTMAVGLILDAQQAEQIVQNGQADLIAIGRQSLYNPNWALHAQVALGAQGEYESWPVQYGWWLDKRQHILTDEVEQKIA